MGGKRVILAVNESLPPRGNAVFVTQEKRVDGTLKREKRFLLRMAIAWL
jgi:hypothetical protein